MDVRLTHRVVIRTKHLPFPPPRQNPIPSKGRGRETTLRMDNTDGEFGSCRRIPSPTHSPPGSPEEVGNCSFGLDTDGWGCNWLEGWRGHFQGPEVFGHRGPGAKRRESFLMPFLDLINMHDTFENKLHRNRTLISQVQSN